MRSFALLLFMLLSGCGTLKVDIQPATEPAAIIVESEPMVSTYVGGFIFDQPSPPLIDAYGNIAVNDKELKLYTDDYNWYLVYIFTYTSTLNQYALSRGWVPIDAMPICRLVVDPGIGDMPEFVSTTTPGDDLLLFKLEMLDYIDQLRDKHKELVSEHGAKAVYQRMFCTY